MIDWEITKKIPNGKNATATGVRVVCDDCGAERWYAIAHARKLESDGRCLRCIVIERNKSEQGRYFSSLVGSYERTDETRQKQSDSAYARWTPEERQSWEREGNPVWNGGRTYRSGYVMILCHGHHLANRKGYVSEHVLAAEEMLGRNLLPDEIVHHDNEIKDDNRPKNLIVMTQSEHTRLHNWRRAMVRQCSK